MHGISFSVTITSAPSPIGSSALTSLEHSIPNLVKLNADLFKTYQALHKEINGSSDAEAQCGAAVNIMGLPDQTEVRCFSFCMTGAYRSGRSGLP